ncbi:MAG: SDR family oxidoreductase [Pseudomonadota bacterium]
MTDAARTVLITGASTGIGYAAAQRLASAGWRVFAGVRKQSDADRVAEIEGVTPVFVDVTDGESVASGAAAVRDALSGRRLNGLVNNAGVAVAGPLLHLPIEEMERQLDINVTGQLRVTQAFVPLMIDGDNPSGTQGRIVNMSSVAGLNAAPLVTPYACSKFALEAFTQGLRREMALYEIDVVAINPGPIATPIWDKAEEVDPEQYRKTDYYGAIQRLLAYMLDRGRKGLPPDRVAEAVERALIDRKPKLNTIVTPEGFQQWLLGVLPKRITDRIITKQLGLTPAALKR